MEKEKLKPMYVRVGDEYFITAEWCKELFFDQREKIRRLANVVIASLLLGGLQIVAIIYLAIQQ